MDDPISLIGDLFSDLEDFGMKFWLYIIAIVFALIVVIIYLVVT